MSSISPTRNPSTAGARYLFQQKEAMRREYVQRVKGNKKHANNRFEKIWGWLKAASYEDLKVALANKRAAKLNQPCNLLLTADLLLIEGELGYRKGGQKKRRNVLASYRDQVCSYSIRDFIENIGQEKVREILLTTASRMNENGNKFEEGTNVEELVDSIIEFNVEIISSNNA